MIINVGSETKIKTDFGELTISSDPMQKCIHIWIKDKAPIIEIECNHIRIQEAP